MSKKAHFLNEKQKVVKQKIMEDLLEATFGKNLQDNLSLFPNPQHLLDLWTSIIVMYVREVLVHLFKCTGNENNRKNIMKDIFSVIKTEIDKKCKTIPMPYMGRTQ